MISFKWFGDTTNTIISCEKKPPLKNIIDHPSLLRTFGFSLTSTYDSYLPLVFAKISKYLCLPFLRPLRSKEAAWSRSYGHFQTRNGSKSTITPQKSDKVNKVRSLKLVVE